MYWRSSKPARLRIVAPEGFCVPCQPSLSPDVPTGAEWIHEVKFDGYRIIARKDGSRVRLWSRQAIDFTGHFTQIAKAVSELPVHSALIDGEAVFFDPKGHSLFNALRAKEAAARAILVGFDLLELGGVDLRPESLEARRRHLSALLLAAGDEAIQFSEAFAGEGPALFAQACAFGLEGIISKRAASPYRSGRSKDWLKIKNPGFIRR